MFNRDHINYGSRVEPLQAHEVIMSGIRKKAEQTELEKLREQNRELAQLLITWVDNCPCVGAGCDRCTSSRMALAKAEGK